MAVPYRVFLAHRKDCLPDDATRIWLTDLLTQTLPDRDVRIVCGFEDYAANFVTYGGWAPWIRMVGAGVRIDGKPTYEAYVSPEPTVGKATFEILTLALQAHRRVFLIQYQDKVPTRIVRILTVRRLEGNDFAAFGELVVPPSEEA